MVRATKEVYSLSSEFMWPLQVGRVSQFINSKPHYGIALATPLEALDPDLPPSYATLHASQKKAATRRYANQDKDQVIRGHSRKGPLKLGQLVRIKLWHDGGGTNTLSWNKPNNTAKKRMRYETKYIFSAPLNQLSPQSPRSTVRWDGRGSRSSRCLVVVVVLLFVLLGCCVAQRSTGRR